MRYGIPYRGSKGGIAKWVVDSLPAKRLFAQERFANVVSGGGDDD